MSGTLYGVGIGPGDPELITLKARAILETAPVIAYPAPEGGESLVRTIASPHVPAGRIEVVIATPMSTDRFPAQEVYDRYAEILGAHLSEGRDVALLCEGDPFLYGSFMYLFERIARNHPTVVVPGVSSLTAVAAAAGRPLVARNEILTVIPAPLSEAQIEAQLASSDAAIIMKVGRHLAKVRAVLARLGLDDDAVYVERATMANQRIVPLTALERTSAPYFSAILVRPQRPPLPTRAPVPPVGAAIIALSQRGATLAARLRPILPGSRIHGLNRRTTDVDIAFDETIAHIQGLFHQGVPIVGLCAAGILIRAIAPLLANKRSEPAVVAVAEDGSAVVPLLGGHHGANRLARAIANATGGTAAITTASDVHFGIGLDDPPPGWRIPRPEAAKAIAADLVAGNPVRLEIDAGDAAWLNPTAAHWHADGQRSVRVTHHGTTAETDTAFVLHPPVLAVGVGCERDADPAEVLALVKDTLREAGLAEGAVACVASLDLKSDEPAVHQVAAELGVPARFFTATELEAEAPRLATPSEQVFREVGCHGVAEGAALAAAGANATLIVPKVKSARATCAIALNTAGIDAQSVGRARGHLAIIGIGPGQPAWRTAETTDLLLKTTDVVGLPLYVDLVSDLVTGKGIHVSELSQEEARVRAALDLAASGRRVALISSGDAGIYGLATLAFELIENDPEGRWRRIEVTVAPGITALAAAASRIGAPIGHDFCTISLSDLLTPWQVIERRLQAAAEADFVIGFYNPVSMRRRTQLMAARDILLAVRPPATPVVLARNLGRKNEQISVIDLADLSVDQVDMLTLVLVGSSQSRRFQHGGRTFVYTPRGYASKRDAEETAATPIQRKAGE